MQTPKFLEISDVIDIHNFLVNLLGFLEHRSGPVSIGFGSMVSQDSAQTTRLVIDALRKSGQRAILATGWGGLLPREVLIISTSLNPHRMIGYFLIVSRLFITVGQVRPVQDYGQENQP